MESLCFQKLDLMKFSEMESFYFQKLNFLKIWKITSNFHLGKRDAGALNWKYYKSNNFWSKPLEVFVCYHYLYFLCSISYEEKNQSISSPKRFLFENFSAVTEIYLFGVTGLFLYPLKASENLWFSNVFRGYRKRQWHQMG